MPRRLGKIDRYLIRWWGLFARRCRQRPLLPWLLGASLLLLACTANRPFDSPTLLILIALAGVLGVWAGRLRPRVDRRAAVCVAFALLAAGLAARGNYSFMLIIFGAHTLAVAGMVAGLDLLSQCLGLVASGAGAKRVSLGSVLAVFTTAAIAFAVVPRIETPIDSAQAAVKLGVTIGLLTISPVAGWVLVRALPLGPAVLAVGVVALLVSKYGAVSGPPNRLSWGMLLHGVVTAAWLLGVRVKRRARIDEPSGPLDKPSDKDRKLGAAAPTRGGDRPPDQPTPGRAGIDVRG